MGIFAKREEKQSKKQVVVTGKRVKGVWTMETAIRPRQRRNKHDGMIVSSDNRRIRTLH